MKVEVSQAIEDIKRQFPGAALTVREDGQGGAHVVADPIPLSEKFIPQSTWIGFHIPAQYPYADIYPVFISAGVRRANGQPFVVPVTPGHQYEGRPALQVSRRNSAAQNVFQKVAAKVLKVMDFLEKLP
jgi:hypothetical protein